MINKFNHVGISGPFIFDIMFTIGIIAESMTGAISSSRRSMDIFGVIAVAVITALGGGVARDILLGNLPVTMILEPKFFIECVIAAIIALIAKKYIVRLHTFFLILDSIGLIAFAYIGSNIAYDIATSIFHMNFYNVIVVGLIIAIVNGIAGGIMRDMICNDIPIAFKSELYASVAGTIGAINIIFIHYKLNPYIGAGIIIIIGMFFRILIIKKKWELPKI